MFHLEQAGGQCFTNISCYNAFAALLNMVLFDEIADSLLLMFSGMFLMMFGGWLLYLCTYSGVLFGFKYGLCSPVRKFIVMSRKPMFLGWCQL